MPIRDDAGDTSREFTDRLARILVPGVNEHGLTRSLQTLVLGEALANRPAPRTLAELRDLVCLRFSHRGSAARELLVVLSLRARDEPDLPLDQLVD